MDNENLNPQNPANSAENENISTKNNIKALKYIIFIVAVFLGIFIAVYAVIDANTNRFGFAPFKTFFSGKTPENISATAEKTMPVAVKAEKDKFVITINLREFDNNPDNVTIDVKENAVRVSGNLVKKDASSTKSVSFSQNIIFAGKADVEKVTKIQKSHKLVITVPMIPDED